MKQIVKYLNFIVLAAATVVIASVFYEGMVLKWLPFVPIIILIMDTSFIISTVCNLVYYRKHKIILGFSILSLIMILVALVMKAAGFKYPVISLVFWDFYILFYYCVMTVKQTWRNAVHS